MLTMSALRAVSMTIQYMLPVNVISVNFIWAVLPEPPLIFSSNRSRRKYS